MKMNTKYALLVIAFNFLSDAVAEQTNILQKQTRIIGGYDAPQGRYPYLVTLINKDGSLRCGGILVAPDIILTAAHCDGGFGAAHVGRWNQEDTNEDYDSFGILSTDHYIHPSFVNPSETKSGVSSFDFMLLKMNQTSSKDYIKLNENSDIPTGQRVDEVTALGFGSIASDSDSYPTILQKVDLTYISKEDCDKSKDPQYADNYQGLISDDMLCAGDYGQDSCQGDSGGPLIIDGGSPDKDIVVGLVSWGFGCALPAFPGVYARVSHVTEWIKQNICFISDNPPDEYDCSIYAPPPGDNSIPVTVSLTLDEFPVETGWTIRNMDGGEIFGRALPGHYTERETTVMTTVFLPAGSNCIFEITDAYSDGMCCKNPGNYVVLLGRAAIGTVLASGGCNFGSVATHELNIPEEYVDPDQDELIIGEGQLALTIVIQLDSDPLENGWRVDRLGMEEVEGVVRVPPGVYKIPRAKIIRTIAVDEGELYSFSVSDLGNNGIEEGYIEIFLGTTDINDNDKMIFENKGEFEGSLDFSFISSFNADPNSSTSAPNINNDFFLTLELRLDLYPQEIGFQVRAKNSETAISRQNREDTVIFFRPPRYYIDKARQTVTEIIPLPTISPGASREFTFIITDSHGDGLCCTWNGNGGEKAGYTMFERGPGLGKLLFSSNMEGVEKEVKSFIIEGPSPDHNSSTLSPTKPLPTVDIKVKIALDGYPLETGFFIEDLLGNRVVDVASGTYFTPDEIVEEIFTIEIGVYSFSIIDSFGNGLESDESYYRLEIAEDDRPALISGNGKFNTQESKTFVLEGETAGFPLSVEFSLDDQPTELGFFVKRLDLLAPEAFVAEVPKGTYTRAKLSVIESLMIRKGGLYIIVFDDSGGDGIGGNILVKAGSNLDSKTYSIDFADKSSWQLKFLAGSLPALPDNAKTLDLRVRFDQFPQEFEWSLVGHLNVESHSSNVGRALEKQEVVAFSATPYSQDLEEKYHRIPIHLPLHTGEKSFTMIISDSEGDGICCDFSSGGPVELFDGTKLLFSDPFQGVARAYHSFTVIGNDMPSGTISRGHPFTMLITLVSLTVLFS